MAELIVVVALVVVTSAACSLFEAVLYSVPASRIEMLERAGRPAGRILKRLTYNCWITIEEIAASSATTSIRSSAIGAAAITAPLATRVAKVGSVCPQLS